MSHHSDTPSVTGSPAGGGGRWDSERFFRERDGRSDSFHRERRTAEVLERDRVDRRVPAFTDRLRAEERFGPPARRPDRSYNDEHLVSTSDAVIPYRSRRTSPTPPPRPRLLRRQSSLDTFDLAQRRAYDYGKYDREDYGPPVIPIRAPTRARAASRAPSRAPSRAREMDFEEIRIIEPEFYDDEDFYRMRGRPRSVTPHVRNHPLHERVVREQYERPFPRRGKTRMPKRLIHPTVIAELGYEYEDEV